MDVEKALTAVVKEGGPVALLGVLWYLSMKHAWSTVDRLAASLVRLAQARARGR